MEDFRGRLTKMKKHLGKWARRQGITCYRVYDADIPEYPFSIDVYEDALYVSIYIKSHSRTDEEQIIWINDCLTLMCEVMEIKPDRLFVKERARQKGKSQYEKFENAAHVFTVNEQGLLFEVNLSDYLDTGLFLDHRQTRQMVREEANGKRFLNLFAYTGSFTVYAAAGGAAQTTTVDLSKTYLTWAKKNLELNGLYDSGRHVMVQADVKAFLESYRGERFDLIVMDPPTFSNSKRMDDILDIQRDHVSLINGCLQIMNTGGRLYFSNNYRGFKLQTEGLHAEHVREISHLTIPPDFRNKKIHKCFLMEK